jgi:ATP-dependent Clp protease ATP-binding subunit ClpA
MATLFRQQRTQAMQRRLARRPGASGILGLAGQFQTQITNLTQQYETEFSQYQKRVDEMMGRFQQESSAYESAFSAYTRDVLEPYQQRLQQFDTAASAFRQRSEDISAGRLDTSLPFDYSGKNYWVTLPSGQRVESRQFQSNLEAYGYSQVLPAG